MSKYFSIRCPVCGERLMFYETKKEILKGSKHFTTNCSECGLVLTVDIKSKRKVDVQPLVISYKGNIVEPDGFISGCSR